MVRWEQGKHSWGYEEVFHEDGGQFDEIGGTAGSGNVLVLCAADHGYEASKTTVSSVSLGRED